MRFTFKVACKSLQISLVNPQPSPVYFNSASPPMNNYTATYPQYCQSTSQAPHASSISSYLDLGQTNPMHGVLTTAPLNAAFYPEFGNHTSTGTDITGNYPCTFHQYSWLKSTTPEFWWNTPGVSKYYKSVMRCFEVY